MNVLLPTTLASLIDAASTKLDHGSIETCACPSALPELAFADDGDVEQELPASFFQHLLVMSAQSAPPSEEIQPAIDVPVEDTVGDSPIPLPMDSTPLASLAEVKPAAALPEPEHWISLERPGSTTKQRIVPHAVIPPSVTPLVGQDVKPADSTPHDLAAQPGLVASPTQPVSRHGHDATIVDGLRQLTDDAELPRDARLVSDVIPSMDRRLTGVPAQPTSVLGRRAEAPVPAFEDMKPAELMEATREPVMPRLSKSTGEAPPAPIIARPVVSAAAAPIVSVRVEPVGEKLRHEVDAVHPSLGRPLVALTQAVPAHETVAEPLVDQVAAKIIQLAESPDRVPTRIEVELDPPDLGSIRVELTESNEGIRARIHASRESTVILVDYQMANLKQTLADAGVDISELQVSHDSIGHEAESNRRDEGWRDDQELKIDDQVDAEVDSDTRKPPPRRREVMRGLVDLRV